MSDTPIRTLHLVDLPRVHRLIERAATLDTALAAVEGASDSTTALISRLIKERGLHTFVGKVDGSAVMGQYRLKPDSTVAHITLIAPDHTPHNDDHAWLHLLDAIARSAGRRGAHQVVAELAESSPLFETLRRAGFGVYTRQEIWLRMPTALPAGITPAALVPLHDRHAHAVEALYHTVVPPLIQPVGMPEGDLDGWLVWGSTTRARAVITTVQGRNGIYAQPLLHPDMRYSEAAAILAGAVHAAGDQPFFVCVRRYQDWLEEALARLGFEPVAQQALMVRHIAVPPRRVPQRSIRVQHAIDPLIAAPGIAYPPKRSVTLPDPQRRVVTTVWNDA